MVLLNTSCPWQRAARRKAMPIAIQSTVAKFINAGEDYPISPHSVGPENFAGIVEIGDSAERVNRVVRSALKHPAPVTDLYHEEDAIFDWSRLSRHDQNARSFSWLTELPKSYASRIAPASTFHAIQEWEGYVVDVGTAEFMARLIDVTADSAFEEEEAVIPLEEISEDDADHLGVGKIFRWVIGYERSAAGTKKRVSQIVFRDLPAVTKTDLQNGREWAQDTIRSLGL